MEESGGWGEWWVGGGGVIRTKGRRVWSTVYNPKEGQVRQRLRESIALATFMTRNHNKNGDWNRSHMRGMPRSER